MWVFTFCNNVVRFQDWFLRRRRFIPHRRASKGERAVEAALRKHGIRFETQYELGYYDMKRRHHRKTYLGYDPTHMGLQGYLRCTRLILPVVWQSLFHTRVRHEMCRQLFRFFL